LNKRAQFYLILTAFIVSAFLIISSSLLSFKETTQINIEIPFSDLPKVAASIETSVRNNLELTFEKVEETGDITYLTNGLSNLVSGQYLIQEGELNYFLDNFDLGIYNVSDLTILGPSSFEIGLPEAKILRVVDLTGGRYSVEAKPGLGDLLVQLHPVEGTPYVYIVDEDESNDYTLGEKIIYLTYDYTSSMRATKDGDTYLLGETARVYADEKSEIRFRLGNMKQDHVLTLTSPSVTYLGIPYSKGEVIAIKENGEVLGLIMVGEVDAEDNYLDYILLNLQKKISGQEKRKVSFDPYPKEGLKDNEIYCNVYPERIERGDKVVITSIIHDNLSTEISDEDLACNNRITPSHIFEGTNFTDIEPFGFFITEPFIEKEYEMPPLTVPGAPGTTLIEMGYHKDILLSVVSTPKIVLKIAGYGESTELPVGESADILGSYIKVVSIEGPSPYTVKIILKNPYLKIPDEDNIIDHASLHGLENGYYVNVTNDGGLFFGDTSGSTVHDLNAEKYKYVDLPDENGVCNGEYDYKETIILDSNNDNIYNAGDSVKKGIAPLLNLCPLEPFNGNEKYIDIDNGSEYDPNDIIFIDNNPPSGMYDTGEPVIPTFKAGDFFVLENYLCFIESYDSDGFFRVVPVYTKGEQEIFTHSSYKIFKGFDSDYNLDASKLVKFEYEDTDKGWNFHDVSDSTDIYFNSYTTEYDANATVSDGAVDDGIVYAFFDGNTSKINEKDFYHLNHNVLYEGKPGVLHDGLLSGFDVKAMIYPSNASHPDQFYLVIKDYGGMDEFTIPEDYSPPDNKNLIREGDTFFVA